MKNSTPSSANILPSEELVAFLYQFPDPVACFDFDGNCRFWNHAFSDLINLPREISHRSSIQFQQIITSENLADKILSTLKSGKAWNDGVWIYDCSKQEKFVFLQAYYQPHQPNLFLTVLKPDGGKAEQDQRFQMLNESEERYRAILKNSPNLIIIHNGEKIIYANPSGQKLLRAAHPDDLIRRPFLSIIHPGHQRSALEQIQWMKETFQPISQTEIQYIRLDQSVMDLEVTAIPFEYHGETLIQVIGVDITEKKQYVGRIERAAAVSDALLEAANAINSNLNLSDVLEEILEQALRVIPCKTANVMLIDQNSEPEGLEIIYSRGYERMSGSGINYRGFKIQLSDIPILQQLRENPIPLLINDTRREPDWKSFLGSEWVVSYITFPLIAENQVFGFLNLDSDIPNGFPVDTVSTIEAFASQAAIAIQNARLVEDLQRSLKYEKAMRDRLIQNEKLAAMGKLIASVAHELSNPLQTIQNCLFIMKETGDENPEIREYLETSLEEAYWMSDLVGQLRSTFHTDVQTKTRSVYPGDLVVQVLRLLHNQLERKRIDRKVEYCRPDISVHVIPNQIKQVFLNICQNAIEAMEPGGGILSVRIFEHENGKIVGIAFEDTGAGIAPDNAEKVFDPFYTTRDSGLGIGLSLCKDIIDSHGGDITVSSDPGKGSVFTVYLPIDRTNQGVSS